jgi:hypothetical protein
MRHMRTVLQWKKYHSELRATDGLLRYRISLRRKDGGWVRVLTMNGVTIGSSFPSVKAAIDYVEKMPPIDRTPLPYWKNHAGETE